MEFTFAPMTEEDARAFRLFVMTFNERAIRVYERAGFERVKVVIQHSLEGERPFLEMRQEL
jgi:[ribosomal protein S18]-alanine N-acetyltransferase